MKEKVSNSKVIILLVAICIFAAFLRFYKINTIPDELYGDIDIIYELIHEILIGHWPIDFVLSNGPFYGYLISPIIAVFGQQGYLSYKLASIIISFLGIISTYFFAKELSNKTIALFAAFFMGTSSWFLIFSRLGNAQVVIPALVATTLFCLLYGIKRKNFRVILLGLIIASLGYFEMPQTFILPLIYILISLRFLKRKQILLLLLSTLILAIPFVFQIKKQEDVFLSSNGYIGAKYEIEQPFEALKKILENTINSLLMLHYKGGGGARSNPGDLPELDYISGLFFFLGILFWFRKKNREFGFFFLLSPFILLLIPTITVINESIPTPSASRAIGILPIVAVVVASGIWVIYETLNNRKIFSKIILIYIMLAIISANWIRYFVLYTENLPNKNISIGKYIAESIDKDQKNSLVYISKCCWGKWGELDHKSILYVIESNIEPTFLPNYENICTYVKKNKKVVFIISPEQEIYLDMKKDCAGNKSLTEQRDINGEILFYTLTYQ